MSSMLQQPIIIKFAFKTPLVLLYLIGYYYAFFLIINYKEDTSNITNAGFVIIATISALSFTFAQVVEENNLKDRLVFAGERLLHGAILVIVCSLLKYLILTLIKYPSIAKYEYIVLVVRFTFGLLTGSIFLFGVSFAHTGLRVLNDLLLLRITRHKDWDNIC